MVTALRSEHLHFYFIGNLSTSVNFSPSPLRIMPVFQGPASMPPPESPPLAPVQKDLFFSKLTAFHSIDLYIPASPTKL